MSTAFDPGIVKTLAVDNLTSNKVLRTGVHTRSRDAGSSSHAGSEDFAALPLADWVYLRTSFTEDLQDSAFWSQRQEDYRNHRQEALLASPTLDAQVDIETNSKDGDRSSALCDGSHHPGLWSSTQAGVTGCNTDYIQIRDGCSLTAPLMATYCGSSLPPVVRSFSNCLHVRFVSDGSVTGAGFQASYIITPNVCTVNNGGCGSALICVPSGATGKKCLSSQLYAFVIRRVERSAEPNIGECKTTFCISFCT
ncbi:hypothetical protein C0Q70_04205 [Pomacea canaliculata]|uniref:CUB domain-containing protein n=1 Tax=Pomacea canaliculata TaxID=400727 RepID=A0A2T7PUY6_POMCA|nr:hypothetical protein C0Q70_04205 [Pomacea canaliculata]